MSVFTKNNPVHVVFPTGFQKHYWETNGRYYESHSTGNETLTTRISFEEFVLQLQHQQGIKL
ncbi:hypothetical protein [Weissella confusa]|uniref:hypothetical protein n=1 Tax=Weissella confusa TaxID=1583 RepID=UPI00223B9EB2|nr:hypothetical protein [Weissella confusa]MCS9991200.1 hypothetical protein [Weissella confusa]